MLKKIPLSKVPSPNCLEVTSVNDANTPNSIPFKYFRDISKVVPLSPARYSPVEIFKSKGEIYFRKMERHYLKEVLKEEKKLILSIGGGTPCYYDSMDYINNIDGVTTVYLNTSVKELSKRLFEAESDRPLLQHLNSMEEFQEFVGKHLFERSVFYNKAHHAVSTDGKSIEEVVTEIKSSLA